MWLHVELINNRAYRFDMSEIADKCIEAKPYRFVIKFKDGTFATFNMRYIVSIEIMEG